MLAFSQNFSSKWNCHVTSKSISILTNTSSKKGFFSFSHKNVPDISSVCWGQYLAFQLGSLTIGSGFITQPYSSDSVPKKPAGKLRSLTQEWEFPLFILFSGRWDINGPIATFSKLPSWGYKRLCLFIQGWVNNAFVCIVVYLKVIIEIPRHLCLKTRVAF